MLKALPLDGTVAVEKANTLAHLSLPPPFVDEKTFKLAPKSAGLRSSIRVWGGEEAFFFLSSSV